jgi:hypothetical protein
MNPFISPQILNEDDKVLLRGSLIGEKMSIGFYPPIEAIKEALRGTEHACVYLNGLLEWDPLGEDAPGLESVSSIYFFTDDQIHKVVEDSETNLHIEAP